MIRCMVVDDLQSIREHFKDLLDLRLHVNVNFDLLSREIKIGERRACYYCIDGFIKDEMMEKMLQYFIGLKKEDIPQDISSF